MYHSDSRRIDICAHEIWSIFATQASREMVVSLLMWAFLFKEVYALRIACESLGKVRHQAMILDFRTTPKVQTKQVKGRE